MSALDTCRAAERMWNRLHWQQCFDFEELDTEPFPIPAAPAFVRFSGDTPARWQRPETLLADGSDDGLPVDGAGPPGVSFLGGADGTPKGRPFASTYDNGRTGSPTRASACAATGGEV